MYFSLIITPLGFSNLIVALKDHKPGLGARECTHFCLHPDWTEIFRDTPVHNMRAAGAGSSITKAARDNCVDRRG